MRKVIVGITARLQPPESGAMGVRTKTLQYVEQSVACWLMSGGALPIMIPKGGQGERGTGAADYMQRVDALVLQGGADIAPQAYGETPLDPGRAGDRCHDLYELELFEEAIAQDKPVLGICRGAQLINVAFGGTLYQDVASQTTTPVEHHNLDRYENTFHTVQLESRGRLASLFPRANNAMVNSIHHQAVKDLGRDLVVEARSQDDGLVEALRREGPAYVLRVQWHPEFHDARNDDQLDSAPILGDFLAAAKTRVDR